MAVLLVTYKTRLILHGVVSGIVVLHEIDFIVNLNEVALYYLEDEVLAKRDKVIIRQVYMDYINLINCINVDIIANDEKNLEDTVEGVQLI